MAPVSRPLFLDPSRSISYEVAVRVCQHVLGSFAHGTLKTWAQAQQPPINYTMLVNFKNNHVPKPMPQLVQRILQGLGLPTHLFREPHTTYFLFQYQAHFDQVQQHLIQIATRLQADMGNSAS